MFIKEFRIFYIILTLIAVAMCFIYRSLMMPVIALILLILPVLSFLLLLLCRMCVKLEFTATDTVMNKHEQGKIEVFIKNNFILTLTPLQITGYFQGEDDITSTKRELELSVKPFSSVSFAIPYQFPYRGTYQIGIEQLIFYDLFKLFRLKKKVNQIASILVVPREILLFKVEENTETDSEKPISAFSGFDNTVFSFLREYREGDTMRQIHWKLSAKQDNLIVKHLERPRNNSALIFCDFTYACKDKEEQMRLIDTVIEATLALNRKILCDGNTTVNCWQDFRTVMYEKLEVQDLESYADLFYRLSMLPSEPFDDTFLATFNIYGQEISADRKIYIITPSVTGELVSALDHYGLSAHKHVMLVLCETDTDSCDADAMLYLQSSTFVETRKINEDTIQEMLSDE